MVVIVLLGLICEILNQPINTGLVASDVPFYRWCLEKLLYVFSAAAIIFGHNPYKL